MALTTRTDHWGGPAPGAADGEAAADGKAGDNGHHDGTELEHRSDALGEGDDDRLDARQLGEVRKDEEDERDEHGAVLRDVRVLQLHEQPHGKGGAREAAQAAGVLREEVAAGLAGAGGRQ